MKNIFLVLALVAGASPLAFGQAYRDSALAVVGRRHLPANVAYVNAPNESTEVYVMPKSSAALVAGRAGNGSQVSVLNTGTPDWCFISINAVKCWIPKSYIVANLYQISNPQTVAWKNIVNYPNNASLEIQGSKAPLALTPETLARLKQRTAARKH